MARVPRISIVTPSFNQGRYIGATIESVLSQEYPDLEHIVIDGGSSDETLDVLRRYPHLRVISEPDRGHADAINKGFALATGSIWGFLNSDDTLLPKALQRVAREIDPARGRHVVMGRCRFTDADGRFVGIEHPSYFENHRRVLEVWRRNTIPQPAVFWSPEVWHRCGPAAVGEVHVDYDLFCRFSAHYAFHFVDQVLATYRLQPESSTSTWSEEARLEDSIRISRRYWRSPTRPMFWRLVLSLALYRLDRIGRANRLLGQARQLRQSDHTLQALALMGASTVLAPEVAFYMALYPRMRSRARGLLASGLRRLARRDDVAPQTAVYLSFTDIWADRWAGPHVILSIETSHETSKLHLSGSIERSYLSRAPVLNVSVDSRQVAQHRVDSEGSFDLVVQLPNLLSPGRHQVDVRSSAWYVPTNFNRGGDYRPLAWRVRDVALRA